MDRTVKVSIINSNYQPRYSSGNYSDNFIGSTMSALQNWSQTTAVK